MRPETSFRNHLVTPYLKFVKGTRNAMQQIPMPDVCVSEMKAENIQETISGSEACSLSCFQEQPRVAAATRGCFHFCNLPSLAESRREITLTRLQEIWRESSIQVHKYKLKHKQYLPNAHTKPHTQIKTYKYTRAGKRIHTCKNINKQAYAHIQTKLRTQISENLKNKISQ